MSGPSGSPLPGTPQPPPSGLFYRGPPPPPPQFQDMSEPFMDPGLELEDMEDANQQRYGSLLAAVVVLGLLILAAIIGLYIFTGIEMNRIKNTVNDNEDEIEKIWKFLIKNDRQDDKDLEKLEKWVFLLLWKTSKIQDELDAVKNCTEQIKEELNNITDCSEIERDVEDILNCTQIIKEELVDLDGEVNTVKRRVDEVLECTEIIKTNLTTINDEVDTVNNHLNRMSKLPLARVICGALENIELPASVNVLISSNMDATPQFPITSVDYNVDEGAIVFTAPNINPTEQVILHVQARVLVSNIQDSGNTFALIMSRSENCTFGDCDDGIYSTTAEYNDGVSGFGANKLWMELNTKINVDGSGIRLYFFMRSNQGGGVIRAGDNDASQCASLWLSFEALAPIFVDANP